jgi:hypothetical protein
MGKGKIKEISPVSTSGSGWSSIKVTLDDERVGEILIGQNKSDHPFKEGMEIFFDEENSPYGLKLKRAKPAGVVGASPGGGGKPKVNESAISANVAMSESVKILVAGKINNDQLFPMADKIYNWIKEKGGF